MTAAPAPGVFLPWDTEFFGFRIGRVTAARLTADALAALLRWSEAERLRCLYFSADPADGATLALAHQAGFQFVDLRVDLSLPLGPAAASPRDDIRTGTAADLPALQAIARTAHQDTRFFKDRRFPVARAGDLYAQWICRDLAQHHVLVALRSDQPAGYLSCLVDPATQEGRIGLIAVAAVAQGQGLGRALVAAALDFFRGARCREVRVATQAANLPAQRLYQAAGFRTREATAWFHRWSAAEGAG